MRRSIRPGKSGSLPQSVQQKLNKYGLAAGAAGVGVLALGHPAEGKVVYTPADTTITPDHIVPLDLNHDGIVDFRFKDLYQRSRTYGFDHTGILSVLPANAANKIEGFSRVNAHYASALRAGASIGTNARFTAGPNRMEEAFIDTGRDHETNGTCFGTWPSGATRYLGLQFVVNGEVHFGWARLNVSCKNLHVVATLTGYAYETVANRGILAGETKWPDETSAMPEASVGGPARKTAALGLLALGSQSSFVGGPDLVKIRHHMRTTLACFIVNLFLFTGSIVAISQQSTAVPVSGAIFHLCTEKKSPPGCVWPPRLISSSPAPTYTEEARKAKIEGICVLSVVVDAQGMPTDISVIDSLGRGLDEKAIEAVRQWKFAPGSKDGKPIAVQIPVEVSFHP